MSKVVELSDGVKVLLNDKFTPKKRNEIRSIAIKAKREDVESENRAINVFIEKVQKEVKQEGGNIVTEDLSVDYLSEEITMEEYDKIVEAVLDIVKFDKGVYRLIGVAFNKIEMTEEEKERMQKKMLDR